MLIPVILSKENEKGYKKIITLTKWTLNVSERDLQDDSETLAAITKDAFLLQAFMWKSLEYGRVVFRKMTEDQWFVAKM